MAPTALRVRRLLAGKRVALAFTALAAGTLLLGGSFVPGYLAVLLASGVRNVYLPWLANGVGFWTVAVAGLYVQAVAAAAVYGVLRALADAVFRTRPPQESA